MFSENLVRLRGKRTQAEIAELAGIPLRSYQRAEYREIPQQPNREAIAKAFGVPVNSLFIDSSLRYVSPTEALRILADFVESARVLNITANPIPEDIQLALQDERFMDIVRGNYTSWLKGKEQSVSGRKHGQKFKDKVK